MPTRVWIVAGPEWRATIAALRLAEKTIPAGLRQQMREGAEAAAQRAKAAVMKVGVRGGPAGHTGLRARVAGGVGVRSGIGRNPYSRIYTSMAEQDEAIIPRGLDSPEGWRHPVFGHRDRWVTSLPTHPGWFTDTIADQGDNIQRALEGVLERAAKEVDAAS